MEKKQKRRLASFITAMSVFVSTGVFWQLRGIGTAMTDETLTANEYDTAAALSASNGSLCETDAIWESTLPELTNEPAENAALIAASQLGYTENKQNYILGGDGFTHKNYSRYGAWFGNPYGDWNTMFTCFCLYYAGVKEADIPFGSGCWAWSLKLNEKGMLLPLNRGSPKRGDVLLLDTDLDGKADRSGIISDISESCINTIEGQVDGAVAECSYSPDDEHITGYVPVEAPENGNVSLMEFSAESESGIKVFASAERGIFPDGTKMLAADIPRSEALEKAAEALDTEADDIEAVAVDISFCSTDGIELEPADSSSVHVEIVLPEEQKLGGGEYNLLHIADSGDTEIIENAEVSENGAEFDAESFSIYVVTSEHGDLEKDRAVWVDGQPISNTIDTPYLLYVGDTLALKTKAESWTHPEWGQQGFPYGEYNGIISGETTHYNTTESGIEYINCEVTFQALKQGETQIHLTKDSSGASETFYVKVIERPQIYVNTALGERHKDTLHEYLSDVHGGFFWSNPELFVLDDDGNPKYVKNSDVEVLGHPDGGFGPYRVSSNDVIEVVSYCKPTEKDYYDFDVGTNGTHNEGTNLLEKIGASTKELVTSGEHKGEYRISAKFRAKQSSGTKRTGIRFGSDFFYIVVNSSEDDIKTHADIEIDDGGKYNFEEYSFDSNGNIVKTITEYSAAVADINSCKIYGIDGAQIRFKESTAPDTSHAGQPVEFVKSDYYKRGNLGEAQFELTSNYMDSTKQNESNGMNQGGLWLRGNKNFSLQESYRADFNVDLELHEVSKTIETYDSSGNLISSQAGSISNETVHKSGLDFSLGRQSILDAYNKCPVHTGLDFTLAANAVMVDFELKKEFVGGDISSKQFEFQLLDENDNVAADVYNDTNGIISFRNIYFNKAGTYNYTVHELTNSGSDIIYANDRTVTINVTETNGLLTATIDIENLVTPLVNYQTYTLPSTGGGGVVPYMITGSAFIILSFAALLRKRKEDK